MNTKNKNINEIVAFNIEANPNILWDLIKRTVRNETIKFATKEKKETNELETNLRSKIDTLTKEIGEIKDEGRLEQIRNELQQTKNELESIIERELNGLIKANIIENNERTLSISQV